MRQRVLQYQKLHVNKHLCHNDSTQATAEPFNHEFGFTFMSLSCFADGDLTTQSMVWEWHCQAMHNEIKVQKAHDWEQPKQKYFVLNACPKKVHSWCCKLETSLYNCCHSSRCEGYLTKHFPHDFLVSLILTPADNKHLTHRTDSQQAVEQHLIQSLSCKAYHLNTHHLPLWAKPPMTAVICLKLSQRNQKNPRTTLKSLLLQSDMPIASWELWLYSREQIVGGMVKYQTVSMAALQRRHIGYPNVFKRVCTSTFVCQYVDQR